MKYSKKIILCVVIIFLFVFGNISLASSITKNYQSKSNCQIEPFFVAIPDISGGFGVHSEIVSGTNKDIYDVGWKISLNSGGLLLIGKKRTGMIDTLHAGETVKIWSFVFGIFGYGVMYNIRVSVFYNGDEIEQRDAIGKVSGPYVSHIFLDPPI